MKSFRLTFLLTLPVSCALIGISQSKGPPAAPPPEVREAQEAGDRVYSSKEVDVKAKVTNRLEHLPEAGRDCPQEGMVRLRVVLHKSGKVTDAELIEGLGCSYDEAVVRAVRKYKFTPALKDREAVSQYQIVEYRYERF